MNRTILAGLTCWVALNPGVGFVRAADPGGEIRFGRDVMPILSENCFSCHGPDEAHRKGKLRLDTREGALKVVDLKEPGASELLDRVTTDDAEAVMPPPSSKKPRLTPAQVETLRKWVAAGAPWGKHWSFEKPTKPKPPGADPNPIDAFVRDRLSKEGLKPNPPASAHTLARRAARDLTGLPPSDAELKAYLAEAEKDPRGAYDRWVDRLLASEHFGERMAMWWLDAARYADTDGYQGDDTRTNWPWRDWVVDAFNRGMPFDRFTIEQFAGDLLPNATPEQKLATCFHRNHMTNGEGGRDPEESRVDYVIDRVNTSGTLWLGLTVGCAQCHSHKFDPITQKDYYAFSAFFNSIDEDGKAGKAAKPYLSYRSKHAERAVREAEALVKLREPREAEARRAAETPFRARLAEWAAEVKGGFRAWRPIVSPRVESTEGTVLTIESDGAVQASGPNPFQDDYRVAGRVDLKRVTGFKLEVLPSDRHTKGGLSRGASGEFILTDIKVQARRKGSSQVRDILVSDASADVATDQKGAREYGDVKGTLDDDPRNGWTTKGYDPRKPHVAVFGLAEPLVLADDEEFVFELRQRSTTGNACIGRFRLWATDQAGATVKSVETPPLERLAAAKPTDLDRIDPKLREVLFDQFLVDHEPYRKARESLALARRQLDEARKAAGKLDVMVLAEREKPRPTHILIRGVWDKKGETVERDVPEAIAPWTGKGPRDRMELARWIVSRDNPLTARVIVNHLWQIAFGAGLVRTPEDFGLQGERPTHPELLDYLAVDFMESGWDVKRLLRLMVTSETYRQSSEASPERIARDPENRLLARSSRYRLPSWMIRDGAMKSAGLLNPALGGPPVRPFQPDGVWEEMFMGRFKYEPSEGAAQYRRTLYAFWRRAIAPTFLFDSAQRRVCEVRLARTNTPLQALTLLNDGNMLAAARALGDEAADRGGNPDERIASMMFRVVGRTPTASEARLLREQFERETKHYRNRPEEAEALLARTRCDFDAPTKPGPERAAYVLTASLLLNLDEAVNRE